jgi:hypothetical protein
VSAERVTQRQAIVRYPRLIAHLMCESLGYFCPLSAANAIAAYLNNEPFGCEWYAHMLDCSGKGFSHEGLLEVNKRTIQRAIAGRHRHKGPMAEIQYARQLVWRELENEGISHGMFAGWF